MIEIKNKNIFAQINEEGAYVEKFTFLNEQVFFDKKKLSLGDSLKIRGGMHVCAPNFSDDNLLRELPSHGFGRDRKWQVIEKREDFLRLRLDGYGTYEKVSFEISYKLEENGLLTRLVIDNKSEGKVPVAPAFHPYFKTKFEELELVGHTIDKKDLPASIFIPAKDMTFRTKKREIKIVGEENVGLFTLWTDFLDSYICIEPTYNGKSFLDDKLSPYYLGKDQSFIQEFKIIIRNL